jgi:acyl-coenzyme A thioesterase PaaI-like protein
VSEAVLAQTPGVDDVVTGEAGVRASFARQGFMAHLGAELSAVGAGTCTISCRSRPELTQQHGFMHAGVVAAIADSAAGYAALSLMPAGREVLTVEF